MDNNPGTEVEILVFRGRLTEADAVNIQRCHDLLVVRRSIRRVVIGLATFVAALSLGTFVVRAYLGLETPLALQVVTAVVLIGWVYLTFGLQLERAWHARCVYRRQAADHLETEITVTPDRLTVVNDAMKWEFQWRLVKLIADAPAGTMICNATQQALIWLPSRLFVGNQSREQVLKLAASNGVPIKRLT